LLDIKSVDIFFTKLQTNSKNIVKFLDLFFFSKFRTKRNFHEVW